MVRRSILAATLLLAAAPAPAEEGRPPAPATIRITGEASAAVVPDRAVLTAAAVVQRPRASDALDAASRIVTAGIAVAKSAGVAPDDIATVGVGLTPLTDTSRRGPPVLKGFEAREELRLSMPLTADVGAVTAGLVAHGINVIDDLALERSDEAATRDRLKAEAARDARRQADIYAGALGIRLGRVLDVAPGSGGSGAELAGIVPAPRMRAAASEPVPVAAGSRRISEQVAVTFALEP